MTWGAKVNYGNIKAIRQAQWTRFNHSNKDIESRVNRSPQWSSTTKLVVALTMVAIMAGLLIRFRQFVGPLLISFVLAYILYPIGVFMHKRMHISWRLSSLILFLLLLIILGGVLTLSGLAIVDQVQNLINFLQLQIKNLPEIITNLTAKPIDLGFYQIDLAHYDLTSVVNQLLGMVQPFLTNTANLLTKIATTTATTVAWLFFIILIAYFILAESGGARTGLLNFSFPGYQDDFLRLGRELSRIWDAFLRGQIIIFLITVTVYTPLLGGFGVKYYYGIAILAGLARFVPYVGPWVTWITAAIVMLFQGTTIFGLSPLGYVIMVILTGVVIDFLMDNFIVPLLMSGALNIHPAAVMIAALVSASLFGLVGVLLAAPVLATLKLFSNYVIKKLTDQDPWESLETLSERGPTQLAKNITEFWKRVIVFGNEHLFSKLSPNNILLKGLKGLNRWIKHSRKVPEMNKSGNITKSPDE